MNALILLLRLRLRGWVRRLGRGMKTVRGALLAVLGGLIVLSWFGSLIIQQFLPGRERAVDLDDVRLYGPLILLGYCILSATTTAGERSISFSPAETCLLFPGPFTRRQLLLYRIANTLFASLISTLIFTFVLLQHASSFGTAFVGLLLAMTFMQLFPMALVLLGEIMGAKAYTWQRRIVLGMVLAVLLFAAMQSGRFLEWDGLGPFLTQLAENPVLRTILTPLSWFVEVFTAEQVWPDLLVNTALCLLVNGLLIAVVLGLDAHYLESAATASEKLYAKLQRLRRGGAAAAWTSTGVKPRFSIPSFPRLGGVGPIAWRQMVSLLRGIRGLLFFLVIISVSMSVPMFITDRQSSESRELPLTIGCMLLAMCLLSLPLILTFDFRGDVDRIDALKTLPIPAWRLVVGQLLAPVAATASVQVLISLVMQLVWGDFEWVLLGVVVFGAPVTFLFFAIENLMFLWFPTRLVAGTVADFQLMGRHLLLYMAKFLIFGFTMGTSALVGGVVYVITDSLVLAGVTCWPVVVGVGAAMVPLIASAFKQFDVARDTPA